MPVSLRATQSAIGSASTSWPYDPILADASTEWKAEEAAEGVVFNLVIGEDGNLGDWIRAA